MTAIDRIIDDVIAREGGYANDPRDAGGETMFGITAATARANGYAGPMRLLPRSTAVAIYRQRYVDEPGFAALAALSLPVAARLVDSGVNMGPTVAARMLQRALNALNDGERLWKDIVVDGRAGPVTYAAMAMLLKHRGAGGEKVLLTALIALAAVRYIELAEARPQNEAFLFGWLARLAA